MAECDGDPAVCDCTWHENARRAEATHEPRGYCISSPGIVQRGRYLDEAGVERVLDTDQAPVLELSDWVLATGARWGRVLYFADWIARSAGVKFERALCSDKEATLGFYRELPDGARTRSVDTTVPWSMVETGYEEGWRGQIAAAVGLAQNAREPAAEPGT